MAYTAKQVSVEIQGGNVVYLVDITNSVDASVERVVVPTITPESVPAYIQRIIELREARDEVLAGFTPGDILLPRDRDKTPDELARDAADAFFANRAKLASLKAATADGFDVATELSAAQAINTDTFLPEYATDHRFG